MTKFNDILAPDPTWSCNENKDYLLTVGGVNFRLSEYAGAEIAGVNTRIILKSGKELTACIGFYEFAEFVNEQANKTT